MSIEKYRCKDFPITGVLRIPKKFQVKLGLLAERRVEIAYEEKMIFIRKENPSPFTTNDSSQTTATSKFQRKLSILPTLLQRTNIACI